MSLPFVHYLKNEVKNEIKIKIFKEEFNQEDLHQFPANDLEKANRIDQNELILDGKMLWFGTEYQISRSLATSYRFTGSIINPLEVSPISGSSYARNYNQAISFFAIDKLTYKPWDLILVTGLSGKKNITEKIYLLFLV